MIPIYTEPTSIKNAFPRVVEDCIFCGKPTRTWHENTNNPVCILCAKKKKVSDIKDDHGKIVRKNKKLGIFDREDSIKVIC